jgi:hypothetical protein
MDTFLTRLEMRIARDLRYAVGMLCMYRGRLQEYECDLDVAGSRHDDVRIGQIEATLDAFRGEMAAVEAKERSARARLALLRDGGGFPNRPPLAGDAVHRPPTPHTDRRTDVS